MTQKPDRKTHSTLHREIQIKQHGEVLQLLFASEPNAVQSAINRQSPQQLVMKNLQYLMGILLFMPAPKKILLLGVGAGSLIHFFRHYLPECHITGVDNDPQLLQLAHQQMMLPPASERLEYVIEDAREYLNDCQQQYDLIVVDIFNGSQSAPWLLHDEVIRSLQHRLSDQGALAYNLLISSESTFTAFYSNLRQVFAGQTLCLETEEYENLLLYALNFQTKKKPMAQLLEHCQHAQTHYQLPFSQILSTIYAINPVDSGII